MVFVLDKHKKPLMPTTPKRARHLLQSGRAVVHRVKPFVIRLRDRRKEESVVQSVALKIDPGSKTSGVALVCVEPTSQGEAHHAIFLAEVHHRGAQVHKNKVTQASARRRRRSANLRYRQPRFLNRRRKAGWLPPSLRSRIHNLLTWTRRLMLWSPIARIEVEEVRFDTQLLENPQVSGLQYQRGELFGWEARAYLLLKYNYCCVYCGKRDVPFELDHIQPVSRGGSNRVSNLCVSCHECNQAKGNKTACEFGHPQVEMQAKASLRDAAAVNTTSKHLIETLACFGLPTLTWTGSRTRWNRERFGIEKTHALDALCVGEVAQIRKGKLHPLSISAMGRGDHCRTLWDKHGFARGNKMRQKQVKGVATGDLVKACVPASFKAAGRHIGRVAVRTNGFFAISTASGKIDPVPARFCQVMQHGDGYEYHTAKAERAFSTQSSKQRRAALPPTSLRCGSPRRT